MRVLIKHLLNLDGSKRPNINQVLAFPLIKQRIANMLTQEDYMEEFAHTVLHNRNVFAELKAEKKAKKEGKAGMLDDMIDEAKIAAYKPKIEGVTPDEFRREFAAYVEQLSHGRGKPSKALNPHIPDGESSNVSAAEAQTEEVDDDDDGPPATDDATLAVAQQALMSRTTRTAQEQALLEMTSFTPAEFSAMMTVTFGEEPFKAGYQLLKANKQMLFEFGTDEKISELLSQPFPDVATRDDFIKRCSAYMIVQGVKL